MYLFLRCILDPSGSISGESVWDYDLLASVHHLSDGEEMALAMVLAISAAGANGIHDGYMGSLYVYLNVL
jgi:hypothetical protein